ncbi:MAG: PHP domain-containing protein, partial [Chloroflexota bacterium]
CREAGAPMVLNTDAHDPADLATFEFAQRVARGAGLSEDETEAATVAHPLQLLTAVQARRARR